jgi:hypothetical protein
MSHQVVHKVAFQLLVLGNLFDAGPTPHLSERHMTWHRRHEVILLTIAIGIGKANRNYFNPKPRS